jgi:hypothetical protein
VNNFECTSENVVKAFEGEENWTSIGMWSLATNSGWTVLQKKIDCVLAEIIDEEQTDGFKFEAYDPKEHQNSSDFLY